VRKIIEMRIYQPVLAELKGCVLGGVTIAYRYFEMLHHTP
jgi:hypothetical protein